MERIVYLIQCNLDLGNDEFRKYYVSNNYYMGSFGYTEDMSQAREFESLDNANVFVETLKTLAKLENTTINPHLLKKTVRIEEVEK